MTISEKYTRMQSFARIDGAKLGLMWIVSFALFTGYFKYPICGTLWLLTMVFTPFYVAKLTYSYSENSPGKHISYSHAFAHSFFTVFYASLILAISQWFYFQYIDHGYFIENYSSILTDANTTKQMEALGYSKEMITGIIEQLRSLRPIDISLQILWGNILAGMVMGISTALFVSVRRYWSPRK